MLAHRVPLTRCTATWVTASITVAACAPASSWPSRSNVAAIERSRSDQAVPVAAALAFPSASPSLSGKAEPVDVLDGGVAITTPVAHQAANQAHTEGAQHGPSSRKACVAEVRFGGLVRVAVCLTSR